MVGGPTLLWNFAEGEGGKAGPRPPDHNPPSSLDLENPGLTSSTPLVPPATPKVPLLTHRGIEQLPALVQNPGLQTSPVGGGAPVQYPPIGFDATHHQPVRPPPGTGNPSPSSPKPHEVEALKKRSGPPEAAIPSASSTHPLPPEKRSRR